MSEWVDQVRSGGSLDGIIPVDAPPTAANADALDRRLTFIRSHSYLADRVPDSRSSGR